MQPHRAGMGDRRTSRTDPPDRSARGTRRRGGRTAPAARHSPSSAPVSADRIVKSIRHQRVHPVDRDELLGQRKRHAVVIGRRTGNAAEQMSLSSSFGKTFCSLLNAPYQFVRRPVVVIVGRQDGRRPLDGVDLREQRRVDQARLLEQPLVVPERVVLLELVADGVVLEREQRVQQAQPDPAVLGEAGDLAARDRIDAEPSARADEHLAVAAGAKRRLRWRDCCRRPASRPTSGCSR